jgi:hypothetical protein
MERQSVVLFTGDTCGSRALHYFLKIQMMLQCWLALCSSTAAAVHMDIIIVNVTYSSSSNT